MASLASLVYYVFGCPLDYARYDTGWGCIALLLAYLVGTFIGQKT